jgi:ethanolamine permease
VGRIIAKTSFPRYTFRQRMTETAQPEPGKLRRTLGPVMLWGLGVGYVISGEYFGWNLGLEKGGTWGMLVATLIITLMYVAFTLSYTELACAMPKAGGVFVYAQRALGPFWGFLAGLVQIVEFVFAPPAIAMVMGEYVELQYGWNPQAVALTVFLIFIGLNVWGVRQAALFELVVTILAVAGLLLFIGLALPHFEAANLANDTKSLHWRGVFGCLPYAIWFYLAIECVANTAEEARDPQRTVAIGFGSTILTLVVLALAVFFVGVGVDGWRTVVYPSGETEPSNAPLLLAFKKIMGANPGSFYQSAWHVLWAVGLIGFIASLNGIILAAGRATMEMGRSAFLPRGLGSINPRTQTPIAALGFNAVIGIIVILVCNMDHILTFAAFGAVSLYVISMWSLFMLRRKEPDLERPFRAVAYPIFPALALAIAAVAGVGMAVTNWKIAAIFGGILVLGSAYFMASYRDE